MEGKWQRNHRVRQAANPAGRPILSRWERRSTAGHQHHGLLQESTLARRVRIRFSRRDHDLRDKSFTFILKTPPRHPGKKAIGLEKGSGQPNRNKVGKITKAQVRAIAEIKMPDLNTESIESAMAMVAGAARSMGVEVVD